MKKIKTLLKGILIGFSSLAIPGVSASTIAIILCVYHDMIDAISSILKDFKKSFSFLFFLIIGFSLGSFIGANIISQIYDKYPLPIILVILGFIIGSLPRMILNLKEHFKSFSNWLVLIVVIGLALSFSFISTRGEEIVLDINQMQLIDYIIFAIVGLITAGTLVIPGMDFAIVLLALGYYSSFVSLLDIRDYNNFLGNAALLGFFLVFYGIGAFLLSKIIKGFISKHEVKMQFAILAFVLASPIVVVKQSIFENSYFSSGSMSTTQIVVGIVLCTIAMLVVACISELTKPNDTRIEAMKKRNMFRFFFTIGSQFPVALYYLIKMRRILKKNLLTFEERYAFCQKLIKKINRGGNIHVNVYGRENLSHEPTLYIANHQGRYDGCCFFTALDGYPCTMIADKSRIIHHFYIETFALLEGEVIDKTNMREQVRIMKTMSERLANGTSFVAFIEGKYGNNRNTLQEFYTGVLHPAYQSKCRIVPVVLYDSWKVYSISSLRRVEPETHILEPLNYDDYKDLSKNELADLLKEKMQAKIDEIDLRKEEEKNRKKQKKQAKI